MFGELNVQDFYDKVVIFPLDECCVLAHELVGS